VGLHGALLGIFDLAAHPVASAALLAGAFGALCWAVPVLAAAARNRDAGLGAGILVVAAVLRLVLLPLPPSLSDDVLRYVWDGRVAAVGRNPYELPPDASDLVALRDAAWERVPHREVPSVYPPLAMTMFSIAARLPAPVTALKATLAACDLGTCALLLSLARRRGLPVVRVASYAWNPLVTLEVAGMGHVDAAGVALAVLAVALLDRPRPPGLAAAAAAAGGVLAKLAPIAVLPTWARASSRPAAFLAASLGLVAVGLAPVVAAAGGVPAGLGRYAVSWEFNGPLHEPLWRALEAAGTAPAVKSGLDLAKRLTGRHEMWDWLYPHVYPQLLAKLLLAAGFVAFWCMVWRRSAVLEGTGRLFGGALLCSATVYPWYLLWVLPWAALCAHRAWLAASALVLAAYAPQVASVPLFPWIHLGIWVPFVALLVGSRWSSR
jgi:hypothetical protein